MTQIRGCGAPEPKVLYLSESNHVQEITTSDIDYCGDLFVPTPLAPRSILLCEECAVSQGVIY